VFLAGGLLFFGNKTFDPAKLMLIDENKVPSYDSESIDTLAIVSSSSIAVKNNNRDVLIYDWKKKQVLTIPGRWQALSRDYVIDWDGWEENLPLGIRWASIKTPSKKGSFKLSKNGNAQLIGMGADVAIFSYGFDKEIEIRSIPDGRKICTLPANTNKTIGIAPDGKTLATYENMGAEATENEFRVVFWNIRPLRKLSQAIIKLTADPRDLRFNESAKALVVCDENGSCVFLRKA
jgi:hypothetical protein